MDEENLKLINRWRLLLGKYADKNMDFQGETSRYQEMDDVLDFLYNREYGEERGVRGGSGESTLTVPKWITKIREIFPKKTVEILEKHALEKYNLTELLTDKEVLEKLEPNTDLLKSILQLKHMLKGDVLHTAERIVEKVAADILKKMEMEIRQSFTGRLNKNLSGTLKTARNINFKRTISKNLKNFNTRTGQMVLERVWFNQRVKRHNPWDIIIAVDESGSMLESVIHSAIMAGIFSKLSMLRMKLIIFDTEVVDLTGYIDDPVHTLMSIQLGGGTDITKALKYCGGLLVTPHRTIVVLVSDLYEGGGYAGMYRAAGDLIESGARLLVLTALQHESVPVYDKNAAQRLTNMGAHVAALTPKDLAEWIAKIIS